MVNVQVARHNIQVHTANTDDKGAHGLASGTQTLGLKMRCRSCQTSGAKATSVMSMK